MILKLLDKIGRKKLVLDRGPSHPNYNNAKPWLNRYYLLFRHRPKWFPFNIIIHEMLNDDHGEGVHSHLCPYITIILRGGYWETTNTGKHWRPPGYIGFEAGGPKKSKRHAAPLTYGSKIGILHGAAQYVNQNTEGQIEETESISAGLDYPGVSPLHCFLKDAKRARYTAASDEEALSAYQLVT